jgi:hypothetical protein
MTTRNLATAFMTALTAVCAVMAAESVALLIIDRMV